MRQLKKNYRLSKTLMARINWKRALKNFHNSYKNTAKYDCSQIL